jgi:GNAT superfamily N-acetyltransferase
MARNFWRKWHDKKLIGYYTLSCDSIRLEMDEITSTFRIGKPMSSFPAIKLARMAFTKDCQNQGCGTFIINIVRGFAHKLNKEGAGCRFITVDAYPNRVNFYLKRGFKHNVHRAYKKKNHPSLRLDVWNPSIEHSK